MSISGIILAAVVVGGTGLVISILLGIASEKFKVPVDEKEVAVRECLPGNNCGGCGFAGCDALAKAIAAGDAPVGACPVGGQPVADKIASIMGVEADAGEKQVAFVKCAGTCDKAKSKYKYSGNEDCVSAMSVPGGKCVATCPKSLIELVPYAAPHKVQCSSKEFGKAVKEVCSAGCIGCKMCTRVCEADAITVENNIAKIDYSKCTGCGKCAEKCPAKIIL